MAISTLVENLITSEASVESGSKSVTIRLSYEKYAELFVLSKHLKMTPSGLLKLLSEDSISEALEKYLSIISLDQSVLQQEISAHFEHLLDMES